MSVTQAPEHLAPLLLHSEVQALLFLEARLLDERRFEEWLTLFTADALYVLPIKDGDRGEPSLIRDTRSSMEERVYRLTRTLANAQTPPSRTQHDVTNVEVLESEESAVLVACHQSVHELREGDVFHIGRGQARTFHARSRYRLVRTDGTLQIQEKRCELLDRDYPVYNLTFIF